MSDFLFQLNILPGSGYCLHTKSPVSLSKTADHGLQSAIGLTIPKDSPTVVSLVIHWLRSFLLAFQYPYNNIIVSPQKPFIKLLWWYKCQFSRLFCKFCLLRCFLWSVLSPLQCWVSLASHPSTILSSRSLPAPKMTSPWPGCSRYGRRWSSSPRLQWPGALVWQTSSKIASRSSMIGQLWSQPSIKSISHTAALYQRWDSPLLLHLNNLFNLRVVTVL